MAAGRIADEILERIRQGTSIVEVVSRHVTLRKAGRHHVGLCPFHVEKTPSFTVNEERGVFHCFGCGAGGSVFSFVMRMENLEFREAVEQLAARAGVTLPTTPAQGAAAGKRAALLALNEAAEEYFVASLGSSRGAAARAYLESRGLGAEIVEAYGLGFCPPQGGLSRVLASRSLPSAAAVDLGLLGRRADGSWFDRFWGRVTFPIRDGGGRILGFGGRSLGEQAPKYLNSPESTLFQKREVLYGLYEARQAIRGEGRVVVVEGYLDAISLVQAGVRNVVASLGTALSPNQMRLARRLAEEVVAFFDGDRAGEEAAVRAFRVCVETNVWGLGAFLPRGYDPDSYVRELGVEATRSLLEHAIPLADFYLRRMDPGPEAAVPQRVRAVEEVAEILSKVEDLSRFHVLARLAAETLRVDESTFRQRRGSASAGRPAATPSTPAPEEPSPLRPEELTLVEAMWLDAGVAREVAGADLPSCFVSPPLAEAARRVASAWEHAAPEAFLLDEFPPELASRLRLAVLGEGPVAQGDRGRIARDCMERIGERARRQELRRLRTQVQRAEASGQAPSLEILRDRLRDGREIGKSSR